MDTLRVAAATDDGIHFMKRHFGDAKFFDVYEISAEGSSFILRAANATDEEEGHADPKKAGGIVALLRKQGVQVGLARVFGPNIKRIKSKLVCVLTGQQDIAPGLEMIQRNFRAVAAEWEKGENRDILDLR